MYPSDKETLASAIQFWESRGVPRRILYQAIIRRELREAELMIGAVRKEWGDQKSRADYHPQRSTPPANLCLMLANTSKTARNVTPSDFSLNKPKGVNIKSVDNDLLSSLVEYWEHRGVPKPYVYQAIIRRDIEETERRNEGLHKQENCNLGKIMKPSTAPVNGNSSIPEKHASHTSSTIGKPLQLNDILTSEELKDFASALEQIMYNKAMYRRQSAISETSNVRLDVCRPESIPERALRHEQPLDKPRGDASTSGRGPGIALDGCDEMLVCDEMYNTVTGTGNVASHTRLITSDVAEIGLQFGVNDTRLFDEIPYIDDTGASTINNQGVVIAEDNICTACRHESADVSHDVFVQTSLPRSADVTFPFHKPKRSRVLVKSAFHRLHKIIRGVRRFAADRFPCLVR